MKLDFGLSSYARPRGDMPELPVINMYVEPAPTEDRQIALQSRPGLTDRAADMGANVRALFQRDLVESSALYGVGGNTFYRDTTALGSIAGGGHVSIAGNEIGIMVTAGRDLYFYASGALSQVVFPDSADVAHVTVGGSRYWLVRKDTGKVYWTDALESDVEALDFATAESLPDRALQTLWIDGGLIIFGSESIEFWQQTGDATLPITPLINMVVEKGLKATGCATGLAETFAWVTNENNVCIQSEKNIVSNPGLQKRIEQSSECSLFTILLDGIEMLVLRIDNETQVFNPQTGLWAEFQSKGYANWLVQCAAGNIMGCSNGKTVTWAEGHEDFGGVMERRFRAGAPINGGGVRVNNLRLRCNIGQTPFLTGDYTEPQVEMRLSDDGGQTFSDWDGVPLGVQGDYRAQPEWRALAMASQPAFLVEFRVTAPVDWRVSDVLINEPWGGR